MTATPQAKVRTALRHAAARCGLFEPGETLVVAYSGGQDSTCLLHSLIAVARDRGVAVTAAHLDHGLRAESAADARRAVEIAGGLGVAVVSRRIDVAAYRREAGRRWSVQHAARAARYQALAAICAELGARRLVVAHTADDQAETLLLNLVRGTGLSGLGGMRLEEPLNPLDLGPLVLEAATWPAPPSAVSIVRPLLTVTRAQTGAYCEANGLAIVLDPTNTKGAYTRNRIRQELLPVLASFNPAIRTVLSRTADLLAEEEEALDQAVAAARVSVVRAADDTTIAFDVEGLLRLPRALRRRLLRWGIERLSGGLTDVPAGPVEDALDFLLESHSSHGSYDLPRGVRAVRRGATLTLGPRPPGISPTRPGPSV